MVASAENGCFIKTLGSGPNNTGEWINMVANFNLTWKTSALEILNYVRQLAHLLQTQRLTCSTVHRAHAWCGRRGARSIARLALLD